MTFNTNCFTNIRRMSISVIIVRYCTSYIDDYVQRELDYTVISLGVSFPDESFKETKIPLN
jgi:hypothetical protein